KRMPLLPTRRKKRHEGVPFPWRVSVSIGPERARLRCCRSVGSQSEIVRYLPHLGSRVIAKERRAERPVHVDDVGRGKAVVPEGIPHCRCHEEHGEREGVVPKGSSRLGYGVRCLDRIHEDGYYCDASLF